MTVEAFFRKIKDSEIIRVLLWLPLFILSFLKTLYLKYKKETPFRIVLVDIKQAANLNEIRCIEVPLTESEDKFKFVALSYRWGELAETIINTNVGYLASVTSFDLADFFTLCKMMDQEPDLQDIHYVWVDAISINQSDYERRKATIYHMTSIYKCASYIVAVPDLHLSYLVDINTAIKKMTDFTRNNSQYIYHLIHDDNQQLVQLDKQWLDGIGVPNNQALRKMLAKYTHQVGTALTKYNVHDSKYDTNDALDHIRNAIRDTQTSHRNVDFVCIDDSVTSSPNNHRQSSNIDTGPLKKPSSNKYDKDWPYEVMKEINNDQWKQQIAQRNEEIRQSMEFLEDIINDWSSRVWVINEYNIAKGKKSKKMKYWFIQLQRGQQLHPNSKFFEFNFDDLPFSQTSAKRRHANNNLHRCIFRARSSSHALTTKSVFYCQRFQKTMLQQLNQQTFLEMILKSKASKNEDRFYAILPLSKYKAELGSKDVVSSWHIHTMVSVKLKLFQWMDTRDKLDLLYLSGFGMVLPTFATARLQWPTQNDTASSSFDNDDDNDDDLDGIHPCNFDLSKTSTIQLIPVKDNPLTKYKLKLKPCSYYTCDQSIFAETVLRGEKNTVLCKALRLDRTKDRFDLVCIPSYGDSDTLSVHRHRADYHPRQLFLVGCDASNTWVIATGFDFSSVNAVPQWSLHYADNESAGFDIY
ncbi:unnamed protein product [Absidia cylindrospora]